MTTIEVTLPTLHADQVRAFLVKRDKRADDPSVPDRELWAKNGLRFKAIRCGRRWGKTLFGETVAEDGAIKGYPVGWFAPDYKRMIEVYNDIRIALDPVIPRLGGNSKTEGVIRTINGGRIDFWTLQDEDAGRSRMYKRVIIDEGAFTDPKTMMGIWDKSIQPTLLDYSGTALVLSNTNGVDPENFFWRICNQPEHGFVEYHAPSHANPTIPRRLRNETDEAWHTRREAEFAKLKATRDPLVYQQEYLAEFIDWSGHVFFPLERLLVEKAPVPFPRTCLYVFAVIDTATKTGKDNDGTGVLFCAFEDLLCARPLIILDYDYVQIEGDLLAEWLPTVFRRLEDFAKTCGARMGSQGVWIEDAASGMVLLQHAQRRGWPAEAIDSRLTSVGKTERAINVSSYVWQQKVALSQAAHERVVTFKGVTRNHLESQIVGFRVGAKEPTQDDLLDTFTYALALSLGNGEGF